MNKKVYNIPTVETAPLFLSACIMSGGTTDSGFGQQTNPEIGGGTGGSANLGQGAPKRRPF